MVGAAILQMEKQAGIEITGVTTKRNIGADCENRLEVWLNDRSWKEIQAVEPEKV